MKKSRFFTHSQMLGENSRWRTLIRYNYFYSSPFGISPFYDNFNFLPLWTLNCRGSLWPRQSFLYIDPQKTLLLSEPILTINILCTVTLQTVLLVIVSQVIVPKIVDSLFFNGTMPGEFLYPAYYFGLDMQKYFFFCVAHIAISFAVIVIIAAAFHTLLFVNVQHACVIFAAIGWELWDLLSQKNRTHISCLTFSSARIIWIRRNAKKILLLLICRRTISIFFFTSLLSSKNHEILENIIFL